MSEGAAGTTRDAGTQLLLWTLLGLSGVGVAVACGLSDDWPGFAVGVAWLVVADIMLYSGLWKTWPRG